MAVFSYVARRSLVPGHFLATEYDIEIKLIEVTPDREILRDDQRTMSGATERQYFGAKRQWNCTTVSVPPHLAPYVREFLHSTEDGQSLVADLYGTIAVPQEQVAVFRTDARTLEQRTVRVGGGGREDYFRFSFALREE